MVPIAVPDTANLCMARSLADAPTSEDRGAVKGFEPSESVIWGRTRLVRSFRSAAIVLLNVALEMMGDKILYPKFHSTESISVLTAIHHSCAPYIIAQWTHGEATIC